MCTIKSLDEIVGEVAKNLNVQPPRPVQKPKESENVQARKAEPVKVSRVESAEKAVALDLQTAKKLAEAVECAAGHIGISVVTAIVNESARLVCLEAMDDSYIASVRAAQDKAYTAVALKMPTYKALEESRGGALDGFTNGNGILMLGGGEPLVSDGRILGGIGVSGGTKDQDIMLAMVAARVFEHIIGRK